MCPSLVIVGRHCGNQEFHVLGWFSPVEGPSTTTLVLLRPLALMQFMAVDTRR